MPMPDLNVNDFTSSKVIAIYESLLA